MMRAGSFDVSKFAFDIPNIKENAKASAKHCPKSKKRRLSFLSKEGV